ncbi:type II toxin-antitoxin system VapC family toxin [Candidatus Thiosymbion oneisti]|uniref:type II toxin-antitoxin system VapC family toxin n=1 Tax=Candidatus Thiosymbion oneisti TaxID=589554 RepID=UPI000B7FCD85|nr:type II toxin-antitoxin system VapC family toxin [Candidatus Thiosymbion oneisti]
MKQKVYLETSIISYYTARPSRDLVIAAWQEITREIWPMLQDKFDIYISALVIQEASRGDKEAAKKRLSAISEFTVLEITPQVQEVAAFLIAQNAIPAEAEEDALHIAVASLNGMEFLLTWNFSHINNAFKKSNIIRSIENQGFISPEICSPEEFIGD